MCPASSDWPSPIPLSWCCQRLAPGSQCLLSIRDCDMGAQSSKEGQKPGLKLVDFIKKVNQVIDINVSDSNI